MGILDENNLLSEKEHALVRSLRKQIDAYELENSSLQNQKKSIEKKLGMASK